METFQEESAEVRKGKLRQMEKDEREDRERQIEASSAPTRHVNAEYFEKQRKLEEQIAANKPVALPMKSGEEIVAEHAARYPKTNHQPIRDHAMEAEPSYVQELHGYTPVKLKPSVVLQSRPDPAVLEEYLSKKPQPGMADIMNRPMSPADQRNAQLQQGPVLTRPTKPCPNCGDAISPAAGYHHRADNTVCILPGNEEFARREGVLVPTKK
jgi:hypothetical protein